MVAGATALRAGWDDDGSGEGDLPATTTTVLVAPTTALPPTSTEGTTVTFTVTLVPTSSTTAAPATTTAPATGLPASLPMPPADVVTLTGSSSYSTTFEVAGVAPEAVLEWFATELAATGWTVVDRTTVQAGPAFVAEVVFDGPGAKGTGNVVASGGAVTVVVALRPR